MDQPLKQTKVTEKGVGVGSRLLGDLGPAMGYVLPPLIAIIIAGSIWEFWVRAAHAPTYLVPAPTKVLSRLFGDLNFFAHQGWITLYEAMLGFALGAGGAIVLALIMASSRSVEKGLFPLAILVKVTPIVAVAPLFTIWFGFGTFPKILIAALLTFYPVLVNAVVGFRSVNRGAGDFLRSLDASPVEHFRYLRTPSALPYLFAAFRIVIPLSVIGAVVGEWFSGNQGLGSVVYVAHNSLDMPTAFAAIFTLAFIGVALTTGTWLVEKRLVFWHESNLTL